MTEGTVNASTWRGLVGMGAAGLLALGAWHSRSAPVDEPPGKSEAADARASRSKLKGEAPTSGVPITLAEDEEPAQKPVNGWDVPCHDVELTAAEVAREVEAEVVARQAQENTGQRPERVERTGTSGTIAGELRKWSTGQTVQLDNGQRWRIVQGDVFFSNPVTNPKVTIEPGFLGAWWMRMDDATPAVKVQRVD